MSRNSSTSAEPYRSCTIAFISFPSRRWRDVMCTPYTSEVETYVYGVHLSNRSLREGGQMSTEIEAEAQTRAPLTRERVLNTAVALADQGGVDALSMRKLAQALDVVPMALYRHVANKDELLDGLVDVVIGEIDPPLERRRLEDRDAGADPLGQARAPPSSLGVPGDGVAHHAHAGRARLHGFDDRHAPHRGLLARPHPPRAARDGQQDVRLHPGAVQRYGGRRAGHRGGDVGGDGRHLPVHPRDLRDDLP